MPPMLTPTPRPTTTPTSTPRTRTTPLPTPNEWHHQKSHIGSDNGSAAHLPNSNLIPKLLQWTILLNLWIFQINWNLTELCRRSRYRLVWYYNYINQRLNIAFAIDPLGIFGPLLQNFLFGHHPAPLLRFPHSRPNTTQMYTKLLQNPSPKGILLLANHNWSLHPTQCFYGHSYLAPTPSITITTV